MKTDETIPETTECRLILLEPDSGDVLAIATDGECRLPCIRIPHSARPARELQQAMRRRWKLHVIILDFLFLREGNSFCAIAEVLSTGSEELNAIAVAFEDIAASELPSQQRAELARILSGSSITISPFTKVGWIDQAIVWVESTTGKRVSAKSTIEQFNAGGAFALVYFPMEVGHGCWLKATGEPNAHEFAITRCLSKIGPRYLPEMISFEPAWNAWLMADEGGQRRISANSVDRLGVLEGAVASMATLQTETVGRCTELLNAGAFDQRTEIIQQHSRILFDYIQEVMSLPSSSKAARIEPQRIREVHMIFDDVCVAMEDLGLPNTIVHGDMNYGNILPGRAGCKFTDWCEAYVGNPLITLQHLLLLNRAETTESRSLTEGVLKNQYRKVFRQCCDPEAVDRGFVYMPLLAIASTLHGRGDWLMDAKQRSDPHRQAYIRNLALHMNAAASAPQLLVALCS